MKTYYDEVNFKTIKDLKNEIRLFVKHRALLENNSMLWQDERNGDYYYAPVKSTKYYRFC